MSHILSALFALALAVMYVTTVKYKVHTGGYVVISGASTGIGRHAAEHLSNNGFDVLAGVRKQSDFDKIIALDNPKLQPIFLDVSKHDSVVKAMDAVKSLVAVSGLPLIAIVNNAGVSRRGVIEFHDLDDARTVFETNVFGMMDLTQMSLPLLRESQGRIVMVSSLSGRIGSPLSGVYAGSKFAMEGMSDSLRREVAPFNISVSVVEPAYVQSNIFATTKIETEDAPQNTVESSIVTETYPHLHNDKVHEKRRKGIAGASPPTVTSEAIFDAITSSTPKTRYAVANAGGVPAWVLALLVKYLPDRVADALFKLF